MVTHFLLASLTHSSLRHTQSTYCKTLSTHFETIGRPAHVVNLDPAAEHFGYPVAIDVRDMIQLEDAMEELGLGPNGGLIYCMEYMVKNFSWMEEKLDDYSDDYLIIDCPGQIDLYTHLPVMRQFINHLSRLGYQMCAVYLMDAFLITDPTRFLAGSMMCMSVMAQLELPHISVLSKCDLLPDKKALDKVLEPDTDSLLASLNADSHAGMRPLNSAIAELVEEYSMVCFTPLDISDEDSVERVVALVDTAMQYGEDVEPKDLLPEEAGDVLKTTDEM